MHNAPARRGLLARRCAASDLLARLVPGMALALLAMVAPRTAAQEVGAVSIRTAPSVVANAGSAEVALKIEIGPLGAIPKGSFVTVRGLPPGVGLKDGHAVGPGSWAVPLSALPGLVAQVADGTSGRSEVVISLIATDGRLLAQDRSALVIQPSSPAASVAAPVPAPVIPELSEEQRGRAERLLARGEAYLANGNIMGARDFFERAADAGLAAAALRLAATYDPAVLTGLKVQGVAPDVALARKWYEHARDLGSPGAAEALLRLAR
jgi:hypothetical protein